jgi:hypothetical protein
MTGLLLCLLQTLEARTTFAFVPSLSAAVFDSTNNAEKRYSLAFLLSGALECTKHLTKRMLTNNIPCIFGCNSQYLAAISEMAISELAISTAGCVNWLISSWQYISGRGGGCLDITFVVS